MVRQQRNATLLVGIVLVLLAYPTLASAKSIGLDPSFGKGGRTTTLPGTAGEVASAEIAVAPGGSIVVANALEGRLVRLLPDGSPDAGFGDGGALRLNSKTAAEGVAERWFFPRAFAVDSRGRVLAFGTQTDTTQSYFAGFAGEVSSSTAVVLRFDPAGNPDPSFGEGRGFIRSDFGLDSDLQTDIPMVGAMAGRVDSRDRPVLAVGVSSSTSGCEGHSGVGMRPRAVVRLTEAGQVDPNFGGGDGVSPIAGTTSFPALAIDGRNRPVADVGRIGSVRAECQFGTTLFRLREDGQRLSGFGANGIRVFKHLHLAVLQHSGAMILSYREGQTLHVARLRPSGRLDKGFGRGGLANIHLPFDVGFHVGPVGVDARGRIVLAGFVGSRISNPAARQMRRSSFVVGRLFASGARDTSLGDRGWIFTRFARPLEVTSTEATLDSRGRLLVAGTVTKPSRDGSGRFAVARYLLGP